MAGQQFFVLHVLDADVDAAFRLDWRVRRRELQGRLEQTPMLGVHTNGFRGRNTEYCRVE